jgi:signal transduction histidine kinase/CheY-like chemotaxis protein
VTLQGRLVRFARRTQLSVKLAWLGAGLMALVVSATVIVLTLQIRANTRLRFEDELRRNQKTFAQFQKQKLEQLTFAASLISQTASLPYALETYSADANSGVHRSDLAPTVQRELERLVRESTKDILFVTDEKGSVFASAARSGPPVPVGTDLSGMREIQQALDVRERITRGGLGVLRQPAADFQVAVYPVEVGGYTLGTLVLGERLDSGFVDAARAAFDGYVVVTVGGAIASGTFPGMNDGGARTLLASVSPADSEPVMLSIASEEFVVAPVRLGETQDGAPVRMWLVQPLTQAVRALTLPLVRGFLVYGVLAVLLAGFGAAVLARSVMRPFNRFVRYLREGTAAERVVTRFDASDAPTEVRTLNESFGELMDALHSSEAQLRQANKLEAIGTLAGGIAHDFNNLLTVITGYADLLTRRLTLDVEAQRLFDNIRNAAERAAVLTGQLLTISRRQVPKPIVLGPNASLRSISDVLQRILGIDITVEWRLDDDAGYVLIDPGRFEQLILNLAINARDAMPDGGRLTIATAVVIVDRQDAAGSASNAADQVRITVADTGVGMDPETRRRCFEPFFTTKDRSKGTGLGLAAVQGVVEEAGGSIEVDSSPGQGTTFTLYFPTVEIGEPPADEGPRPSDPLVRGSETILVVDDQTDVRQLISKVLRYDGYLVLEASDGEDAIRIAKGWEGPIELLVTDAVMPGMRGHEVAAGVTTLRPRIRVLMISGYTDRPTFPDEVVADPLGFLAKPFKPSELSDRVRKILDHRF